jgi:low affinity Fe/Cu permease
MKIFFDKLARQTSKIVGAPWHFALWILLTIIWLISGFYYDFNTTWNFWANTTTTIFTFLICLLIQNAQNHDALAIQVKLDEILRAIHEADNEIIDIESKTSEELKSVKDKIVKQV